MAFITVEQVQAGMVLAAEVTDKRGRLLIPSGRELSPKHVQALRMWGIARVEIEGDDVAGDATAAIAPETLEAARAEIADRLRNLPGEDPLTVALSAALLPRVAREIQEAGHV